MSHRDVDGFYYFVPFLENIFNIWAYYLFILSLSYI